MVRIYKSQKSLSSDWRAFGLQSLLNYQARRMITIRRGLNLPITGSPEQHISDGRSVSSVAVVGPDYPDMKPTMKVSEGGAVKLGQPLFEDKKTPGIIYTALAAGIVKGIHRGEKRKLLSVEIAVDQSNPDDPYESFQRYEPDMLSTISREILQDLLTRSGCWTAFRTRPFSKVPKPGSVPHAIFVTAIDTHPLSPNPEVIINEHPSWFEAGVTALSRLTDGVVHVCTGANVRLPISNGRQSMFAGPHPAGLAGTHIHFLEPVGVAKSVWVIGYQDVIALGYLLLMGKIYTQRIIALSGPQVKQARLIRTRLGANLSELVDGELLEGENRYVSGSVLGGRNATEPAVGFLGRYHNMVTVLKEGRERPMLHYLHMGVNRHSVMPTYVSTIMNKLFSFTTTTNGSPRAMVPVGSYEKVMPLDILPTQLLRALIVRDIEMAEKLGALELDEEDLALCTYVCPGKYEYGPILRDNLTRIEQEG